MMGLPSRQKVLVELPGGAGNGPAPSPRCRSPTASRCASTTRAGRGATRPSACRRCASRGSTAAATSRTYEGRAGRACATTAGPPCAGARRREQFAGERRPPLRAKAGRRVTQMHYARRGEITPEMEFVAVARGPRADVRARRGGPGPGHHPRQRQPPRDRADGHRPQLPGQGQRQHRQLGGHVVHRRGGRQAHVVDAVGRRHRHGPVDRAPTSTPRGSGSSATRPCPSAPCRSTRRSRRSTATRPSSPGTLYRDTIIEQCEQGVDYMTVHAGVRLRLRAPDRQAGHRHRQPGRVDHGRVVPGPPHRELPLHALRGAVRDPRRLRRGLLAGRRPAARLHRRRQRRGPAGRAADARRADRDRLAPRRAGDDRGPGPRADAQDQGERRPPAGVVPRGALLHTRARSPPTSRPGYDHITSAIGAAQIGMVRHGHALLRHAQGAPRACPTATTSSRA